MEWNGLLFTTTSDTTTGTLTKEQWQKFLNGWDGDNKLMVGSTPYRYYGSYPELVRGEKINERSKDMMGLYEVYVVNTKTQSVHHQKVFAKDEVGARVKALRTADPIGFPDDNVEIFVNLIGQWEDKKPKEVKIVKE